MDDSERETSLSEVAGAEEKWLKCLRMGEGVD